jgi:hypothetical protein
VNLLRLLFELVYIKSNTQKALSSSPLQSTRSGESHGKVKEPAPRPTPQERHNVSDGKSDSQFRENKERKIITTPQEYKKLPLAPGEAKRFLPKIANLVANRESNPHSANALRYGPERGHSAISTVANRNH